MPDDRPEDWQRVGERLLMPLPTNEAQESIARRLAQHRNVAVQGPPGTGKTHTIRNLICHLMANGKRVLVVAQKEDPLRVLRDGLPEEVRSLCLAVLGRTTDQLVQLQLAARELSDRAATLDKDARGGAGSSGSPAGLRRPSGSWPAALGGLRAIAENEAATYEIDGVRPLARRGGRLAAGARRRARRHPGRGGRAAAAVRGRVRHAAASSPRDSHPADRAAALRPLPETDACPSGGRGGARRAARRRGRARTSPGWRRAGVDPDAVRAQRPHRAHRTCSTTCTKQWPGCGAARAAGPTGSAGCCSTRTGHGCGRDHVGRHRGRCSLSWPS